VLFIKNITRKCQQCGKKIDIENETDFIMYKDKYYHNHCFIENRTGLKKGKWSTEKCSQELEELTLTTIKYISPIITKHKLFNWIADNYNVSDFPTYFCLKLEDIFNGKYKSISKPIPVEDLYDMWQQKMDYLNKVSVNNQRNGKQIEGLSRANYDLAILLSRYDKYLAWKERKHIEQEQIRKDNENKGNQIDYTKINSNCHNVNVKNQSKNIDINEILNDI